MRAPDACSMISEYWQETRGVFVAPEDIFNYSSTGELFMVFFWLKEARDYFQFFDNDIDAGVM